MTREIEELLPWRATGRLSRDDSDRVDDALATDADLRASLDAIGEDMAAVVAADAQAPAPSRAARDRLMQMIDVHEAARPRSILDRFLARCSAGRAPKAFVLAGVAALLLIVAQAAAITELLVGSPGATYRTASQATSSSGATALVQFAPGARFADAAAFLDSHGMAIVDGPKPGGFWSVRIGPAGLTRAQIDAALATLRADRNLVAIALPGAVR
jgi:hypothetical protein